MKLCKKKRIVLWLAVFICGSAGFAFAQDADANKNTDSWLKDYKSSYPNEPNITGGNSDSPGFGKLLASIFIVLVLGIGAIYLSKKVLPKITQSSGKKIKVTETVYLGPRKALHLVKVGKQAFLIGSTNENITRLADLELKTFDVNLSAEPVSSEDV